LLVQLYLRLIESRKKGSVKGVKASPYSWYKTTYIILLILFYF